MKKRSSLENTLTKPQRIANWIFLLIIFIIMAVPMWNVFVLSTSTALAAKAPGL